MYFRRKSWYGKMYLNGKDDMSEKNRDFIIDPNILAG